MFVHKSYANNAFLIHKIQKYLMYIPLFCFKIPVLEIRYSRVTEKIVFNVSQTIFSSWTGYVLYLAYLSLSKYSIQIGEGNNEENENNIHELATFSNEAFHQDEEN